MREQNKRTCGIGNIAFSFEPETRKPWTLLLARTHFIRTTGSGTSIANMTMSLSSKAGRDENHTRYDQLLWTWRNVGVGADAEFWVPEHSFRAWRFDPDDYLTFAWTNPDPDEIQWGTWLRTLYED